MGGFLHVSSSIIPCLHQFNFLEFELCSSAKFRTGKTSAKLSSSSPTMDIDDKLFYRTNLAAFLLCTSALKFSLDIICRVLDTVEERGLEAVASGCHLLEELRVFLADPFDQEVIMECGGSVATVARNCPNFTHFRLCMMNMRYPDYLTTEPLDEAFGAVVNTCSKLCRLAVSGLLTDRALVYWYLCQNLQNSKRTWRPKLQEDGSISMKPEMKEREEDVSLCQAPELLDSLIWSSYSIQFFPNKWQLIRDKLEQLRSGLTAVADGDDFNTNSELNKLLQAVASTANEARVLAQRCSDESYNGGKLLLRSDLDVITAKLQLHIKQLTEIYASGILRHSQAIILSRPNAGSSREGMRFYVKDLLSRLEIGDLEMRTRALAALNEILLEDEKYVRIVAVEMADGVSLLVRLLEVGEMGITEEALLAVSVIAGFDAYRGALVTADAVVPLIQILETGSELGKERAAQALKKLTENSDNAWSVSAQGGVTTLLKICDDVDSSAELIRSACGILKSLSSVDEIKRFMLEEGAVSIFMKLSGSKEEVLQIQAIEFLTAMACEDDPIKEVVVRAGVIEPLNKILDPNSHYSSKAREVALRAIDAFCFSSPTSINLFMASGFLHRVLFFLRNGEITIQESALRVASRLCGLSQEAKKAMGDVGFMPELVKLLDARSFEVRELAAEAICGMVSTQRNRRRFIQEDQNVNRILQLLNLEEKTVTKKFLLPALMSLVESNSGRKKIMASKYVKHLEKLAETDVTDAKKIVKKLSGNRFRSILTGIWSP
ncbi:putative vacuolar protein 8 [Cocos nucifera]|uniref:Putative vacuolar protein 8 n=1 Tax=Cocos nucifera TaxID=13894 RepID=A0A8K0N3L7_COCNU|nr:putative vacuolar protein 8 [Cocos nucifera]